MEPRWRKLAFVAATLMFVEGCATHRAPAPSPQAPVALATAFTATAYCHGTITAAGVRVRPGFVAADPGVLSIGTTIRIEQSGRYDGVYTVMDTGSRVRGHHVDLFVDDCAAAKRFGRKNVRVTVIDIHH